MEHTAIEALKAYLSEEDIKILVAIGRGKNRQADIAIAVGLTQPTVSRHVNAMVDAGHVLVTRSLGAQLVGGAEGVKSRILALADASRTNVSLALQDIVAATIITVSA